MRWIFDRHKRAQIQAEIRGLLNAVAAAHTGANGGEAAGKRFNELKHELKTLCNDIEKAELNAPPKSKTPRSLAEFNAMLAEAEQE